MYVADDSGKRVVCRHPGEGDTIRAVLGSNASEHLIRERVGFMSDCLCKDCLANLKLDVVRDDRVCPNCGSSRIPSVREMVGQPCPKCRPGTIVEVMSGIYT